MAESSIKWISLSILITICSSANYDLISVCTATSRDDLCGIPCQVYAVDEVLFERSAPSESKTKLCHNALELQRSESAPSMADFILFSVESDRGGAFIALKYWRPSGIGNLESIFYKVTVDARKPVFYVAAFGTVGESDGDAFQRNLVIEFPVPHAYPGSVVKLESYGSNQCQPFISNLSLSVPRYFPEPADMMKRHFDCEILGVVNGRTLAEYSEAFPISLIILMVCLMVVLISIYLWVSFGIYRYLSVSIFIFVRVVNLYKSKSDVRKKQEFGGSYRNLPFGDTLRSGSPKHLDNSAKSTDHTKVAIPI